ncbi:MAG: hypothetical protein RLZZ387_1344 [Chloroflexota bacterium]|jgi:hypothetical protein
MCFSLLGRVQTRLLSLVGPLALTLLYAAAAPEAGYLQMFGLMLCLGLYLEVGVYGMLIGYQPRWLTILLGVFELLLLLGCMRLLGWPVDLGRAVGLYAPAWLLAWLTTHALLPWLAPRWAEDGGELLRR